MVCYPAEDKIDALWSEMDGTWSIAIGWLWHLNDAKLKLKAQSKPENQQSELLM